VTDAIGAIALSEGLPETVRPSLLLPACRIRRDRRRWEDISLAVVTANMVLGGFSDKRTDPLDMLAVMFTPEELAELRAEREEAEQRMLEEMQMAKLRRLMEWKTH
jgi:hypothetical protein